MLRRAATAIGLALVPAAAFAEGTMPQMDFKNPLTFDQLIWMVVILVVLYLLLARWGLPQMGKVLDHRAQVIARDLNAARAAKTAADQAVAEMNAAIRTARANAQLEISTAVAKAKAKAALEAAELAARLDMQLAQSEAQIEAARPAALSAIKPVAEETVKAILARLAGPSADDGTVATQVDAAIAKRAA